MDIQSVIISNESNTSEILKSYLKEYGKFSSVLNFQEFSEAYNSLENSEKVILFIDLSSYKEQALNFVSKVKSDFKNCRVVVLSDKPDMNLVIRSIRVGASDFLQIPIIKDELFTSLEKIYNDILGLKQNKSRCKVISIYSNKGGTGKTSIAVNLASELAKITKEDVALVDLNFQLGDVTTFLDIKSSYNISYILQNLDKINEKFLTSTLEKYKNISLYTIADPPYLKQAENISLKNISKLFDILRETFSYVIVDTSSGLDKNSMKALELSDLVLFPTIVNLPSLRNCQRCLEFFDKISFPKEKIQVIINRYMENDEITVSDVEEVISKKIYWKIPNNYFTMMSAINKGVTVSEINQDSNVALGFKNLALNILDSIYRRF